jgi:hypothetical protein
VPRLHVPSPSSPAVRVCSPPSSSSSRGTGVGEIPSPTRSTVNTASALPPAHDHEGARSGTGMAASRGTGAYIVTSKRRSLNFSDFVARQIWRRRRISPRRCKGASSAKTRAFSRPSRAHSPHLRPSTNCEKLRAELYAFGRDGRCRAQVHTRTYTSARSRPL